MPRLLATLLVTLTSAAVLVLEVLVSRLVAPYVGLTLETYTASIGVALAALAAGAALGGALADRVDPRFWLPAAVAVGAALTMLARPAVNALGPGLRGTGVTGTVLLVLAAVALPVMALATVTPGVVKLRLRTLEETGQTVGRLSALGTLGALAGTFLTGFVLLSALPTSRLLLVVGALLAALSVGSWLALRPLARPPVVGLVLAALTGTGLVAVSGPCQVETRYYCATVVVDPERSTGRTLVLDGLRHSYVDLADPAFLQFAYTRRIADVLATRPPGPLDALHLGGGGFSLPRHLAAVRPGSRSTVLEVDPGIVDIGRSRLALGRVPDLDVRVGDARTSIAELPTSSYDVVVGDAFGSLAVPWHLATREMAGEVRRVLRPGGVYVLNVIDNPPQALVKAETATLRAVFGEVLVMARAPQLAGPDGGNFVLVASDGPLDRDRLAELAAARGEPGSVGDGAAFAGGAQVLTDDDAPVDQLLTPYRAT